MYAKRARNDEFSTTQSNFQPSLILGLGKVVCVPGISTTHTNRDSLCSNIWVFLKSIVISTFSGLYTMQESSLLGEIFLVSI